MNLLLDINIVLDVALRRTPWVVEASALLAAVEKGRATACVAAHTVTTYHYIVSRQAGAREAARATSDLLRLAQIIPLDGDDFRDALALDFGDFEDAVQAIAAVRAGADYLVTRNTADFRRSSIQVRTAGEVLALL